MPELPDITVYVEAIARRVAGRRLERIRVQNPFLLRTVDPPLSEFVGRPVQGVRRVGKRIVLDVEGGLFLVLHLMIAGRLHWKAPGAAVGGRATLAAFDFANGSLTLTEAGSKRRASLHAVRGEEGLRDLDRGGLEPIGASLVAFEAVLRGENHTLKRSLTDPRLFSGIGNAYSDEILHRARLSPVRLTSKMTTDEAKRLHAATQSVLGEWTVRLRKEAGEDFPEGVTAFRPEMAVHGKHGQPCPVCQSPVQRIVHAENETNYCATCQTDGKLLADRALSRLLREDWPRTLEELEQRRQTGAPPTR